MPEIVTCPHCAKKLRVPDNLLGRQVKCPGCGDTFLAASADAGPPPAAPPPRRRADPEAVTDRPRRPPADEPPYEDEPPRRSRRDDDDYEDDYDREDDDYDRPRRRRRRRRRSSAAASAVGAPAIALIIIGILGILMGVGNVAAVASGMAADPQMANDPGYQAGQYVGAFLSVLWGIIVTLGGFKMNSLSSRGAAMLGAIFAMVPCNPCCLVGLPIGIWALVTLNNPDVKDAFN